MLTGAQNMTNSVGYIKCGEILKSEKGFQDPYILRCLECKEIYLLLSSFIFHFDDTCQKAVATKKNFQEFDDSSANEDEVANEPLECEVDHPVKLEKTIAQIEDPLIVVKNEDDIEKSIIKVEPSNLDETKNYELEDSMQQEFFNTTEFSNHVDDDDLEQVETSASSQDEIEPQEAEAEKVGILQHPSTANDVSSSAFVDNFMKSEENLKAFIAALKNEPQLWNKNMPHYGNKLKRREFMEQIAQDLNKTHNLNLNRRQVSAIVVHLYRNYQEDLQRAQERDDNKKQFYKTPWYLEHLNFIKPYLENFSLEILDPNKITLTPEQIMQILEIYKSLPHLWNTNIIENHSKIKRHESILKMLSQLETNMNLKLNEKILEEYLRTIHNNFSKEKRRILHNKNDPTLSENNKSDYYKNLMFLNDHVPPFRCAVCGTESKSPLQFKIHTSTHDGTLPFPCSQCKRTFRNIKVYKSHALRHLEDLNFTCKECGKKFANYTNLRLHMRIHTGDKPYCCELCGESFRYLQTLSCHRRRHEKRYLHTCKLCSQGFYSKMGHDDHMNSHMNIRPHVCDICNKTFITRRALKLHKVVHEDIKKYACKLCGKTFKHKTGVNQHMKTHNIATTEEREIL